MMLQPPNLFSQVVKQRIVGYGFYSSEAAKMYGTTFYENTEGKVVEVTCVCLDPQGSEYAWKDKVFVGEVVRYLEKKETTEDNVIKNLINKIETKQVNFQHLLEKNNEPQRNYDIVAKRKTPISTNSIL